MNILEVENISKSFGKKIILREVSFNAQQGKIIGIIGENGSGKSTLLRILVGLLSSNSGTVKVQGTLGYCPQEPLVFESLTVRENFEYFATAYDMKRKKNVSWKAAKNELVERFQFQQYEDVLVSQLSGGTKQKLNLCLSLLHSPDLLILDEPYAAFDWVTYLYFWDFISELRDLRKSLILVSHFIYDRSKIDLTFELKEGILKCV